MAAPNKLLLVTKDSDTADLVAGALKDHADFSLAATCGDLSDLASRLKAEPMPAAVIDLGPSPEKTLAELDPLIVRFPAICFVVLTDTTDSNLVFKAMETGARYLLLKDSIETKLVSVLERLVPAGGGSAGKGYGALVTVLSAGGGCGATTLAVNLANELHLLTSELALLVDMDMAYGSVASCLGLAARHGLADILNREGIIDSELIRSTAMEYSEGFHVLLGPASVSPMGRIQLTYDRLGETIDTCTHTYEYVVIDAPRIRMEVIAQLAAKSTLTFVVLQRNVKDIRMAKILLDCLSRQNVASDRVAPIISRYRKGNTTINLDQCKTTLGWSTLELVSEDPPSAVRAINLGQPLSKAAPRSLLRKDLVHLAKKVACRERIDKQ